MIEVRINDEALHLNAPCMLSQALAEYLTAPTGIAVAVNEEIVPRRHWDQHPLQSGDRVLVFNAVAGG